MLSVRRITRSNPNGLKWLVLGVLAWAQLGIAAHSFEHDADELFAACSVCAQLDRDDVLPEASATLAPASPQSTRLRSEPDASEFAPRFSLYSARASP